MGKYNSSLFVVEPVFKRLLEKGRLCDFLEYVLPDETDIGDIDTKEIYYGKGGYDGRHGEKALKPPEEYLAWCRKNPTQLSKPELAKKRLNENEKYIFEGYTHPDVFIETSTLYVVIEAKWTEPRITSHTTWRREGERDQLIRHMDALLPLGDEPERKKVFGLFLIDADGKISKDHVEDLFSNERYIKRSLPHRCNAYELINSGFCGVFTWQEIQEKTGIPIPDLQKLKQEIDAQRVHS